MTRSDLTTALAVLAGFGLVALVLSRGLDHIADTLKAEGPRATPSASPPVGPNVAAALPEAPSPATAATSTPESAEARHNRIQEQAEFAFVRQRPEYVRTCWKPQPPAPGQQPDMGGAFEVEVGFDANGLETSRVVRSGAYAQPALLACVRKTKLPELRIPAPGEAVTFKLTMPIP